MAGLRKSHQSSGGYAARLQEAFKPESSRASIWSIQDSEADSTGGDKSPQNDFPPLPETGDPLTAEQRGEDAPMDDLNDDDTRPHPYEVPHGELVSATADELALAGMADLYTRLRQSEQSMTNQCGWNDHLQQQLTELREVVSKLCAGVEELKSRVATLEEKLL